MKKRIIALSLMVAGLCSCNSDEELIKTNPDFMEDGYAGLTIRMDFPSAAATKALGDTLSGLASVSYPAEKKISSVAFFVKTNDEGTAPNLKVGSFNKFFSTEDLLSANGLNEPLVETVVDGGEYTATIKIKSEGWGGNTKVIVIANYAENGLTEDLKAITQWDDLKDVKSKDLTSNPTTPLLMYGTKDVQMTSGDTKGVEFMMDRLVSRVDILNKASNLADASKGFVLTSAQFINPKQSTYLLPDNEDSKNIPIVSTDFKANTPDASTPLKIDSLYTYETANDGTTSQTAIRVNGTFKGSPVSKVIDFRRVNGLGAQTDTIGLARNRRYLININPTPDSTDVEWTVKVAEWEVADTIRIQPSTKVPEFKDWDVSVPAGWDVATKTYTVPDNYAGGTTIKFTAFCAQSPKFDLAYEYISNVKSFGFDDDVAFKGIVKEGAPVVSYAAAAVTRDYEITIPVQTAFNVPADIYVRIKNSGSDNVADTIKLVYRPFYDATRIKPVLMKDGKFWAPVNVGAKTIPTGVATTGNVTSTCGNLFQWGRKASMPGVGENIPSLAATNPIQSDLEGMEADGSSWKDKFILAKSSGPNTQGNWLLLNSEGGDNPTTMEKDAWYQKLWDSNQVAGQDSKTPAKTLSDPCPVGWRVPSSFDWAKIGAGKSEIIKGFANQLMTITGAIASEKLVLPAAGSRSGSSGASASQGSTGSYWSSSVPSGSVTASNVYFSSAVLGTSTNYRAYGFSVRCVQE